MKKTVLVILICLITSPIISQNNSAIPTQGMVLYYPFSGNANDSSGNGLNGTVTGATLTTDRFGAANSAYSFDGSTSTIGCGDILDSVFSAPVAKFSVSGWADTRAYGSFQTGGGFIIGKNAGGTYGPYQWSVSHVGGLIVGGVFSDTAQQNYVELTCPMTINQWFHFVLIFDGSLPEMQRVKLYVNGQTSSTTVYQQVGTLGTTTTNSAQNLTIGATHAANNPSSPGNFYNGNVDDIRIYNRVLSPAEINSLHYEGVSGAPNVPQNLSAIPGNGQVTLKWSKNTEATFLKYRVYIGTDSLSMTIKDSSTASIADTAKTITGLSNATEYYFRVTALDSVRLESGQSYAVIGTPNAGIVLAGLMAWYPFNGTTSDSSGNGNNGTNNGATLTTDRFGHPGSALRFNGVNNDITFNSVPINAIDNFSISMWINADTLPQTCSMVQIGNDDGANPSISNGYGIGISDGSISYSSGSVLSCILSGTNVVYNSGYSYTNSHGWHHIILVRSGGVSSFYVDGVKTANTSTSIPKVPTQFFIGSQNGLRFFKGSLDDIRIYNRVLGGAEMDSLYHEGGWPILLEPGLVAYYPFNGNANDSSGNGYNGVVAGATLTTDRFGVSNGAYRFNGTSSVIRCGDILDSVFSAPVAKFSVSGWAKTNSYKTLQQDGGYMLGKNAGGPGPYQWGLGHYQGLVVASIFSDTNGLTNYMGIASPMTTNQWFHFVYVFDGSQPELQRLKLYINGQSSSDSVLWHVGTIGTTTVNTLQQFTFGATHARNNPLSLANFYDGTLDDIRIYNKVLSAQEIQSLYHEGGWPPPLESGLVAYYPFNGNANDSSGNGYNGTVSGATLTTDRFGKSNSAYHFTGGSSIGIPELFPDTVSAFTFAAWVMKDTMDSNTHEILYKGLDQGQASLGISNGMVGFSVNIETGVYGAQNWYSMNAPDTLKAKTYYFLVGRYIKGQKIDFSINGTLIGSTAISGSSLARWPGHDYSAIGVINQVPLSGYWNGVIDDIRVYNQALDSATIQSLYHEGGWNGKPNAGIVLAGLMAWYPFNGTTSDSSGNGNNGTNNGATLTTDRFGHPGSALRFNGVNNDITFNSVPINAIDNFSISMWINADTLPQTCSMVQIGNDDGANPSISNGYGIGISDGSISYSSGSVLSCILSGTNVVYNSGYSYTNSHGWHHIILVRSGGVSSFYVDGVKTANTSTSIPKVPTQFFIGSQNGLRFFKGSLDDIRIYNRVLSSAEMDSLYHEGGWPLISQPPKLVAYYPFSGNANDSSGNGYHGMVFNATLAADRFNHPNSAYTLAERTVTSMSVIFWIASFPLPLQNLVSQDGLKPLFPVRKRAVVVSL